MENSATIYSLSSNLFDINYLYTSMKNTKRSRKLTSRGACGVCKLTVRMELFLKFPKESFSATYFHLLPSISSQQINFKLESRNSSPTSPILRFSSINGIAAPSCMPVLLLKPAFEARLALIRSVSRTRRRDSWEVRVWAAEVDVELVDCFMLVCVC